MRQDFINCFKIYHFKSLLKPLYVKHLLNLENTKKEANGWHHSPDKPVQIKKHIWSKLWLYLNVYLERRKPMISFSIIKFSFHTRIPYAKFGWNRPNGSAKEDTYISSMYVCYFAIVSPLKKSRPFIWTNMNSLNPRMLCVEFGWN